MPFKALGPPPFFRLPQVSHQKPPFAWLWNKALGEPMRQQLDQLQRPSAHIFVPGQACWHSATLPGPALRSALPPMWPPSPPSTERLPRGWEAGGGPANLSGLCLSWTSVFSGARYNLKNPRTGPVATSLRAGKVEWEEKSGSRAPFIALGVIHFPSPAPAVAHSSLFLFQACTRRQPPCP